MLVPSLDSYEKCMAGCDKDPDYCRPAFIVDDSTMKHPAKEMPVPGQSCVCETKMAYEVNDQCLFESMSPCLDFCDTKCKSKGWTGGGSCHPLDEAFYLASDDPKAAYRTVSEWKRKGLTLCL
mmetsp:Transcript_46697/g.99706  ORF Transcript_46697/g.99706 Transcript_46697/m.99706 type:complete len:123 (+) Transcript_46697:232-600(+)